MAALYAAMHHEEGGSAQSGFVRRMLGEVKRKNILQKKSNLYAPITSLRKYSTMNSPAVFDPSKLMASLTSKWINDHFGAPKNTTQEYIDNELEGDYEKWKRGKLTFKGDTVSHNGKLYKAKEDTLWAEPPNAKVWQSVAKKGKGRMRGGLENDVTRAYAAMKPMTEDQWIARVKTYNPTAATPANYVKDYLTPWTRHRDASIIDQQPGGRAGIPPGYTEVRDQAAADALGPGGKWAIRNANGSVSAGTNHTVEDLERFEQEKVQRQEMMAKMKQDAEDKYWAEHPVSKFFNKDVVGALTKFADFGSDVVGAVVPGVGQLIKKTYQGLAPPGSKYYSDAPLGQKLLNTAASLAPSPSQVGSFLGSGHMHGLKGEGFFGDMFSAVTKPIGRVVGRVRDALSGVRRDYPPSVRKVIKEIGAQPIARMVVRRDPIPSFLSYAVDLLTMGQFSKAQQDANYDKMFHLCIEFELAKGPRYVIEKNEVISVALARAPTKDTQIATVGMQSALDNTLNGLLKAGQGVMKERWFVYNALSNNCQDFILGILQGNQQITPRLTEFVKQPLESIASSLPEYADKLFQGVTDAAAVGNVVIEGRGGLKGGGYYKDELAKVWVRFQREAFMNPPTYDVFRRMYNHGHALMDTKYKFDPETKTELLRDFKAIARAFVRGELHYAVATGRFFVPEELTRSKYFAELSSLHAPPSAAAPPPAAAAPPPPAAAPPPADEAPPPEPEKKPRNKIRKEFPPLKSPIGSGGVRFNPDTRQNEYVKQTVDAKETTHAERKAMGARKVAADMKAKGLPADLHKDASRILTKIFKTDSTAGVPTKFGRYYLRYSLGQNLRDYVYKGYGDEHVEGRGGGRVPASKFQKQLQKAGISPATYLKKAQDKAKKLGLSHTLLGFSSDDTHKLQIPNAAGKLIRFGSVGLGDHVLYSLAHDPTANEHRARYLARATKIKGAWKSDKYSPNSLAIGVLW